MYRRILAAVNEYPNSEIAARYALGLARACGARFSLVFVAEAGISLESLRRAEGALERLFLEAGAYGLEVESLLERGDPFQKIAEIVGEKEIDLVFTATRREDVEQRYFRQTRARRLMLGLSCSVAAVRVVHPGKIYPRAILVPFRGRLSHLEERAWFVAKLAQGFEAAVTLFHAPKSLTQFFHGDLRVTPGEREAHIPGDMEKFVELLEQSNVAHEGRLGHGRVARAITLEAAYRRHDLIVMGAGERSLLKSAVAGNPVEEVLREAPCNLIILVPRLEWP